MGRTVGFFITVLLCCCAVGIQSGIISKRKEEVATISIEKVVQKLVNLYRLFNGNTKNTNLNSIVSTFVTTFDSDGFDAISRLVDIQEVSSYIFDVVGQTIKRTEKRIRARMEEEHKFFEHIEREKFHRQLMTLLNRTIEELESINRVIFYLLSI